MSPEQEGDNTLKYVACGLAGCLAPVLVLVLMVGACGGYAWWATSEASGAVEEHVELVRTGRVEEAYGRAATELRERVSLPHFRTEVEASPGIYEATELSFSGFQIDDERATLEGIASGPEGRTAIVAELVREGKDWRVARVKERSAAP